MTSPVAFHHADAGTPEAAWLACDGWDRAAVADAGTLLAGVERLLVLAAHPDDETLGAAGLMALAARRGVAVDVVVATDGEASHPGSPVPAAVLGRLRREESRRAAALVAPRARVRFLGLPDGGLAGRVEELEAAVGRLFGPDREATLVVAPWELDGHPDHDALGAAALAAAERAGAPVWRYPIWAWQWAEPGAFPWEEAVVLPLDAAAAHAKHAALETHLTQVRPLVSGLDEGPLLGDHILRRHRRLVETFLGPLRGRPLPAPGIANADGPAEPPSRHVADVLRACVRGRDGRVLELGSAALLAEGGGHVRLDPRTEPVPPGSFDLVVLAEPGAWRADVALAALRAAGQALEPGGELVLASTPGRSGPLDASLVHRQARDALDLHHRLCHRDEHAWLDGWERPA